MKFHHYYEVSCRKQVLWYVMLCPSIYGIMVNHKCVLYTEWGRYSAVKAVLWLGEFATTEFMLMDLDSWKDVADLL